jgi:tRNA modification GTPase
LRDTEDAVEAEGVRRARARAAAADLVIGVHDASAVADGWDEPAGTRVLRVANKVDLGAAVPDGCIGVSALTGAGMEALREALAGEARALTQAEGPPALTRARHRAALLEAADRLDCATAAALPELRSEDVRLALRALGRITGTVGVEDILDSVFRQFCIGK